MFLKELIEYRRFGNTSVNSNINNKNYHLRFNTNFDAKMFSTSNTSLSTTTTVAITTAATAVVGMMMYLRYAKKDSKAALQQIKKKWDKRIVRDHGPIKNIWKDVLYSLEAPGCSKGPPVRNMHIYRLPDGSKRLVIYNGVTINDSTLAEVVALGTPSVLVVPTPMHREDAAIWKDKFPDIIVVCPSSAKEAVLEEVVVDMTIEELVMKREWSQYLSAKVIDGWTKCELVLEVQLESVKERKGDGKIAMVVCDLLFTLIKDPNYSFTDKCIDWFFDSSIVLPSDLTNTIIVPAVSRIARIFIIKDWQKAEQWYRTYARDYGARIALILVGHGVPVKQVHPDEGCTKALEGVADQLVKPRW